MRKLLFIIVALLSLPCVGQITGILSPSDTIGGCDPFTIAGPALCGLSDWQNVGVSINSGINTGDGLPDDNFTQCNSWTQTYPTVGTGTGNFTPANCPAGGADCTPAIQTAYNSCSANSKMILDAGNYPLATQLKINKSNVALWGTVANVGGITSIQTEFDDIGGTGAGSPIYLGTNAGPSSFTLGTLTPASAQAGYGTDYTHPLVATGSTNLTIANINAGTQFAAVTELNLWPYVTYTGSEGSAGGSAWAFNWGPFQGHGRLRGQIVKVTGCNGQTAPNVTSCPSGAQFTVSPALYTSYDHVLPDWQASSYYGITAFIKNGTHYYGNCGTVQGFITSSTSNNFSTPGVHSIQVPTTDLNSTGTTGAVIPNAMCGYYVGQQIVVDGETITLTAVTPNNDPTTGCRYGTNNCPYAGTITASFTNAHPSIANKGFTNIVPYNTLSGSVQPTFPTTGGIVVDSAALPNSAVWEDLGTCPNSPCDTYPQYAPFAMTVANTGVKYVHYKAGQDFVSGGYPHTGGNANFEMNACNGCWIAGNFSDYTAGTIDHVYVANSYAFEVRDNYLSSNFYHTPGGHDGVLSLNLSSRGLVENNNCDRMHGCILFGRSISGNVIGYNHSTGAYDKGNSATLALMGGHTPVPQFNLLEGNVGAVSSCDSTWGSDCFANTDFRNWIQVTTRLCYPNGGLTAYTIAQCGPLFGAGGTTYNVTASSSTISYQTAIGVNMSYTADQINIIGDVVGSADLSLAKDTGGSSVAPGVGNAWIVSHSNLGTTNCGTSGSPVACRPYGTAIFGESYNFSESSSNGVVLTNGQSVNGWEANTNAYSTLARHGVYNYINNTTYWYGVLTHTLPASFYRLSKPRFFGRVSCWPCIGPDVVGGDTVNGHAFSTSSNAAMQNYLGAMGGTVGGNGAPLTTFDPGWPYENPPSAPFTVTSSCLGLSNGTITGNDSSHCLAGGCSNMNCGCTAGVPTGPVCSVANHSAGDAPTYTASATDFISWSGGCSGTSTTCQPDVTTSPTIIARYDKTPTTSLTCPDGCSINYGTAIRLTGVMTNVANAAGSSWALIDPIGTVVLGCTYGDGTGCSLNGGTASVVLLLGGTYNLTATSGGITSSASTQLITIGAPSKGFSIGITN